MTGAEVATVLGRARCRYAQDEVRLQEELAIFLAGEGVVFEREVLLTKTDRIDFMVGTVGVEAKVKGATHAVIRQLSRYAESERVTELVLFTTRSQILVPRTLSGKRVERVVYRTL